MIQRGAKGLKPGDIVHVVRREKRILGPALVVDKVTPERVYFRSLDPATRASALSDWARQLGNAPRGKGWWVGRDEPDSSLYSIELLVNPLPSEERTVGNALARAKAETDSLDQEYDERKLEITGALDRALAEVVGKGAA